MAVFNPQVAPTSDPNYLNYAKEISAPKLPNIEADKSLGVALETAGTALKGATTLADTWVKADISEDLHKQIDAEQSGQIKYLEAKANGVGSLIPGAKNPMDANASMDTPPPSVDAGIESVSTLADAKAAGKINDTLYTQRLNSILKSMRTQYPGYRDYIDEQVQKYTGINPANAYMRNLLEDINRGQTSKKSELDKTIDRVTKELGNTDLAVPAPALIQYLKAGGDVDKVNQILDKGLSIDYQYKADKRDRDKKDWRNTDVKEDAKVKAVSEFNAVTDATFSAVNAIPGLTPEKIDEIIQAGQRGEKVVTDTQAQQYAEVLQATRTATEQKLRSIARKRNLVEILGPEEVESRIKSTLQPYDVAIKNIRDEKAGAGFATLRAISSRQADATNNIMQDPTMGRYMLMAGALKNSGGDALAATALSTALGAGINTNIKNWVEDKAMASRLPDDVRQDGIKKSLSADIAEMNKKKLPQGPKAVDAILNNPIQVLSGNESDAVKLEVIRHAFNPTNMNLLDNFKTDYTDPQTGKTVPGKYSVYNRLTQSDITDKIYKLTGGTGEDWNNYKNWAETSFKTLYKTEIKTLNDIKDTRLKVAWDSDNKQFELRNADYTPIDRKTMAFVPSISQAIRTVDRLNGGLLNLRRVQDKSGTDTSAYLMDTLVTSGLAPSFSTDGSIAQMMANGIASSKKSMRQRMEESFGTKE